MNRYLKFCFISVCLLLCSCTKKFVRTPIKQPSGLHEASTTSSEVTPPVLYSNNLEDKPANVFNTIAKETGTCIQLSTYAKESKIIVGGEFKDAPLESVLDYLTEQAECDFILLDHGCYFVDEDGSPKLSRFNRIKTYRGTQALYSLVPTEWKNLVNKDGEQNFVFTAPARMGRRIRDWFSEADEPPVQFLMTGLIAAVSAQDFMKFGTTFGTVGSVEMSGANKGKWIGNYSLGDVVQILEGSKKIFVSNFQQTVVANETEAQMEKTTEQNVLLAGDKDKYAQIGRIISKMHYIVKPSQCPNGVVKVQVQGKISPRDSSDSGDGSLSEVITYENTTTLYVKNGKVGFVGLMSGKMQQRLKKHIPLIGRIPYLPIGRYEEKVEEDVVFIFLLSATSIEVNEFNPAFLRKPEKEKGGEVKKNAKQKK